MNDVPRPPPKSARPAIISRKGGPSVKTVGLESSWRHDLYHQVVALPWYGFLLASAGLYLGGNLIFAGLYLLQPGAIQQAKPGSFADAFFFSVQTMATIGYGAMSPATIYANCIVTAETLFGMILLALVSGMTFARVSIPTARVLFSREAVVTTHQGMPTLMVRMANQRRSHVVQAEVNVSLLRNEISQEGVSMRRFHDLKLARNKTPVFALTFTVMHVIDSDSPLYQATPETLLERGVELVVAVTGMDGVTFQTIHARTSYLAEEILFNHRHRDVFMRREDGSGFIDFNRFHDVEAES